MERQLATTFDVHAYLITFYLETYTRHVRRSICKACEGFGY